MKSMAQKRREEHLKRFAGKKTKHTTTAWCPTCDRFMPVTPRTIICLVCHTPASRHK